MTYFSVLNENILEPLRKLFVRTSVFIKVSLHFKKSHYNEIELKLNRYEVFIGKMSQSSLSLGKMDLKLNEELNNECMVNVLNNKPLNNIIQIYMLRIEM